MYEELINRLKSVCYECKLWDGEKCCLKGDCLNQTRLEAADAIEELTAKYDAVYAVGWANGEEASKSRMPQWVSVSERLPDCEGKYLCKIKCTKGEWIEICILEDKDWYSSDEYEEMATDFVTHWMPLPEPPKEGE